MKSEPRILFPDHPLYIDAVKALKAYHQAQANGASLQKVERLRLIAEAQFQAVSDYQLRALGKPGNPSH
ncbi:hypothetical protein AS889_13160 [Pseudomonas putida]|uniref:hypothetical protein n=1 Tax=Pseudomonas putida TaxID=303 RepID=UPI0007717258|nr:hypothetical protein [Pseudomonas putida]KWW14958.1 hypothetical protein AS889_13160 [Pseudomonas putida]